MNNQLCGTPLTGELLKAALSGALPEVAEDLIAISAESIGEGVGFMSDVLRVSLSWRKERQNDHLPNSVVVKLPTVERVAALLKDTEENPKERIEEVIRIDEVFRTEGAIYDMFSKELPELPLAQCYCTWNKDSNPMTLLALEDFSKKSRSASLVTGLTEGQLLSCVEAIAKLQAWSLTTKCDWKSFTRQQETLLDEYTSHIGKVVAQMQKAMENYPKHFGSFNLKNIAAFMGDKEAYIAEFMRYREVMPDVLVHGDYRASNILFKIDKESNTPDSRLAAIIDWQMAHQGSFAEDICYLMMFSVNEECRRCKMEEIIRYYLEHMKALVPHVMGSISFDAVCHVFRITLSWLTLFYTPFIVKIIIPGCKNEPDGEEIVLSSLAEGYRDAIRCFHISDIAS